MLNRRQLSLLLTGEIWGSSALSRIKGSAAAAGHSPLLGPSRSTTLLNTTNRLCLLSNSSLTAHGLMETPVATVASSQVDMPTLKIMALSLILLIPMSQMTQLAPTIQIRLLCRLQGQLLPQDQQAASSKF